MLFGSKTMSFKNLGSLAYTTAKAGIIGMTRQLEMELAVARKLVAYLMAVDRGQTHFLVVDREAGVARLD